MPVSVPGVRRESAIRSFGRTRVDDVLAAGSGFGNALAVADAARRFGVLERQPRTASAGRDLLAVRAAFSLVEGLIWVTLGAVLFLYFQVALFV